MHLHSAAGCLLVGHCYSACSCHSAHCTSAMQQEGRTCSRAGACAPGWRCPAQRLAVEVRWRRRARRAGAAAVRATRTARSPAAPGARPGQQGRCLLLPPAQPGIAMLCHAVMPSSPCKGYAAQHAQAMASFDLQAVVRGHAGAAGLTPGTQGRLGSAGPAYSGLGRQRWRAAGRQ